MSPHLYAPPRAALTSRAAQNVLLVIVLCACGGSAVSGRPTTPTGAGPEKPVATEAKDDTSCVVDGEKVTFSELQGWLGRFSVDPTPAYTANLEASNGSFDGTEEHYVARKIANGDVYDYMIVRTPTHHHYELTFKQRGDGQPIAVAPAEPARSTHATLEGREVDERTFERTLQTLEVDAQPWVNAHLMDVEGGSGTSATFEARDRKTGALWTYEVSSVGSRSSRSLSRGSRKSSTR